MRDYTQPNLFVRMAIGAALILGVVLMAGVILILMLTPLAKSSGMWFGSSPSNENLLIRFVLGAVLFFGGRAWAKGVGMKYRRYGPAIKRQ